jgi:cyclic beta-1,2-glucan glucanotransferase
VGKDSPFAGHDEPIRAELFSVERLEQHGESLAAAQRVTTDSRKGRRLSPRVRENGRVLLESYRAIADAIREEHSITPAAEWLVDNFHIVEEQLREIREDLPTGYYRELPKLAEGHLEGFPRVFGLAWAFVAHTDSRFDPEALLRFVRAYQRVQPLTIGELWAIAITLRVILVENLRRCAERIVRSRSARQRADALADRLLESQGRQVEAGERLLPGFVESPLPRAFAVQLVQRLRDQDPATTPALRWLDEKLARLGSTADEIVRAEHQAQAAMNVTVRNVITSMRLMSTFEWIQFFEDVSHVDDVLRAYGDFAAMDFATRDRYRHAIEDLSRRSGLSEIEVAERVVERAKPERPRSPGEPAGEDREADVGYHLISKGRPAFERALGFRPSLGSRLLRLYVARATPGYLGTIAVLTGFLLALPLLRSADAGAGRTSLLILGILALVPASDLAIALLNRVIARLIGPRPLPKLELRDGVPDTLKTLIAVPSLLTSEPEVEELIERLEVHYLSNPEEQVGFALLTDWTDAPGETRPGDDELLAAARAGIARLNERHGRSPGGGERFLLLHRRRVWNEGERKWMGWERKRGKLHELNRLLRGATDTTFLTARGDALSAVPSGVRYVITLDADTRLSRGAARKLIGTMAHPLNRPKLDPRTRRVVEGYAVLQPRITHALPDHEDSFFRRIHSGHAGIDPYASAVSEIYQDLFTEGSYAGKGIYDVDAFEAAIADRVPDNALLSHDLFEGVFARAGCVTDVELMEDSPSHYEVATSRLHRWARGDWQLLPWILGWAPVARGGRLHRPGIPAISRWKMLDNLRRTLSPPAAFLALVTDWALPLPVPALWTRFVLATMTIPPLFPVLGGLLPRRRGISKRSHLVGLGTDLLAAAGQAGLAVILLAHQAWLMTDAIVRTLVRIFVTGRHRLEWVTAAQARSRVGLELGGLYRRMSGAVMLAILAAAAVALARPSSWPYALPFVLLWVASPWVVRWISLPRHPVRTRPLAAGDARTLRAVARRTWRFFETFVGPEDHHLPPDNFQEDPKPVVAHRTSPTNIGLYLLAAVAARDFGWTGTVETVERLEATVQTMSRLERLRGHFFNWYATQDLRPLEPRYVSSVDSGNLAGHLIALAQACREMSDQPVAGPRVLSGIEDAVFLLREAVAVLQHDQRVQTVTPKDLDEALEALVASLRPVPTGPEEWAMRLGQLVSRADTVVDIVRTLVARSGGDGSPGEAQFWAEALRACIGSHLRDLEAVPGDAPPRLADGGAVLTGRLAALARLAEGMVDEMDFSFLFDTTRKLFAIGYRVADSSLDPSYYDLLASEARLTSFVAIAKGDAPTSHWFTLGRPMTPVEHGSALISWSGSMFEYLMPTLVMRSPPGSLLDRTYRLVVRRQIRYGEEHRAPWGVSESAFNARDLALVYQYSNFGVPGLGLKRGLSESFVVSPYSTALAATIDPAAAMSNFSRLARTGAMGPYGFYEAIDYTASRLPEGHAMAVVRAHMAHHQGMSIVAIDNLLNEGAMQARFHASPRVQAAELLLQERTPRDIAVARPRAEEVSTDLHVRDLVPPVLRRFTSAHDPTPRTHLLSNGRYVVMTTAAGSGYSRWRDLAVTRWREDVTRDPWGTYVFLRDSDSGEVWSAAYQPAGVEPNAYEVAYSEDRVDIRRRDGAIATSLEIVVSPEDDAEVRRVSLTNLGTKTRQIELTSYAEIVLAPAASDDAHPVFSNLFVQTESVPEYGALLATRRPRSRDETPVWAAHVLAVEGETVGALQFETDRARFLGRGRTIRTPVSVLDGHPLSNTAGSVLDPIFSLRVRLRVAPGTTARVAFSTLVAPSREEVLDLADKYRDVGTFERTATLAWTQAQVQLHHLGTAPDEAHLFQRLANRILYSDPTLRPSPETLKRNTSGPSALWAHGISGDAPIVLARIEEAEERDLVRQLLRAHEYWRMKGLSVDLVILNERSASYAQDLQASLEALVRTSQSALWHERHEAHGGVFVLRADLVPARDRDLLLAAARAVLVGRHGSLAEQVVRTLRSGPPRDQPPRRTPPPKPAPQGPPTLPPLEFFNGIGGFASDGREHVTILGEGQWTPAPWINVISNPQFGFQVSESGGGYTWAVNSRENQITPWSNDPVSDPPGEAFYVQDVETGELWGPTALPIREEGGAYVACHGHGYSRFQRVSHGVALDLLQFVPLEDPVKISRLRIENLSAHTRKLSVTGYVEWVLGVSRSRSAPFVVTEIDPDTGAMFARNAWSLEFGARAAFFDLRGRQNAWTGDRTEFLGRNGSLARPAVLARGEPLSGKTGAGCDPCGALQTTVELAPGAGAELVFCLGQAESREEARTLIGRYRAADSDALLRTVQQHWTDRLETVQVKTPDRSMDILLNRRLVYQTLACRIWARSAFYQSGGAYGFRDQLQDVMAILVHEPGIARGHLLRAAARQFLDGDVQHWWHPPSGRGVRTRISDDRLWLPYVLLEYLKVTGDTAILDEPVPFLEGPALAEGQNESYFEPLISEQRGTLFEHCARALDRSLATGRHGLPLIGAGDWNDGMNRVGREGKGESVWLGWVLHQVLTEFAPLAETRGEGPRAGTWRRHASLVKEALEREAWDGDWYRRAFFDDGTPLGSAANAECRIDSIAQSWGVISRAAEPGRATRAMAAVEKYLVRRGDGLVLLFTPPFDRSPLDPGYVKGYLPGIRENGGQYTHAAIWAVIASALLGDGDKAGELFAILNPINHASTRAGVHRYKVEPYAVAADIYSEYPHIGRGGWTWYTGAAGWMYRAGLEWILGFRVRGASLVIDPCIPRAWRGFEIAYRYRTSRYQIVVENPRGASRGVTRAELDGHRIQPVVSPDRGAAQGVSIPLADDGSPHHVHVVIG